MSIETTLQDLTAAVKALTAVLNARPANTPVVAPVEVAKPAKAPKQAVESAAATTASVTEPTRKLPDGITFVRKVINPGADPHVGEFYGNFYVVGDVSIPIGEDEPAAFAQAEALLAAKKSATTEPVATPTTAVEPVVQEPKAVTYDDVRAAFMALNTATNRDTTLAVLKQFGVANVPALASKPELFADAVAAAKAAM